MRTFLFLFSPVFSFFSFVELQGFFFALIILLSFQNLKKTSKQNSVLHRHLCRAGRRRGRRRARGNADRLHCGDRCRPRGRQGQGRRRGRRRCSRAGELKVSGSHSRNSKTSSVSLTSSFFHSSSNSPTNQAAEAAPAPAAEAAPAPAAAAAAPAAAAPAAAAAAPAAPAAAPAFVPRADGRVIATPYAKKLAAQLGVDLAKVPGSGPAGRVTADDVEAFKGGKAPLAAPAVVAASGASATPAAAPSSAPAAATTVSQLAGTTVPFNGMQVAVSKNMLESLKVPEFRVAMRVETDALDALYKRVKPKGVTMSALLAKACGVALAKHPIMYAACTADGLGITYNANVNVAMAVAMPDGGLITPVLKNADQTDLYQLSRNWGDLVKRARSKELKPDEYNSGTFTISNLGMFGVETFGAILPPGTAAILAVGGSLPTVVADAQGRIAVRKVMQLNLTADHRIVYGADSAGFLQTLKAIIEDPEQLTL